MTAARAANAQPRVVTGHPGTILHVAAPAAYGGLERVVHTLAGGLAASGYDTRVAALLTAEGEHPFTQDLASAGIGVDRIVTGGRQYVRQSRALAALMRRHRPRVVHTHGYHADLIASRVARSLGIPTVTTVHGFTGGDWKNRLYEWAQRRAFRRFDRVVAVSRPMAVRLAEAGVPSDRIHWIANAWASRGDPLSASAARAALGVHPRAFHVGWVGRLSREKGPDVFMEALGRLRDLPIVASVIGDGPERPSLERRAAALGVDGNVVWHGVRPDVWRLYAGFEAFVLSSRTEGTPIVLFEAATSGTPIVAAEVGGVPDVVSIAECLLVPPGDPAALAAAIRACHGDPAAAAERANAASARVSAEFAVEPWIDRYLELYHSLHV